MANVKLGSHPSHGYTQVEKLDSDKQLTSHDSGKFFMIDQTAVFTINLPSLNSGAIAGWNCKFVIETVAANAVYIMAYGLTSAGGATGDAETVVFRQGGTTDDSSVAAAGSKDGVNFISGAVIMDEVNVFTDGTSWYISSVCEDAAHVIAIDA